MSVECCPGIAESLTTGHVAQFSTPAKREKCWFLFPSKGASHPVVLPHPVFIQTARVFKGYLFCYFEHFTRHITVYSSKSLEYNLVLVMLYWLNPNLFCLSYSSFPVGEKKKKCIMGEEHSLDSLHARCVPVLAELPEDSRRDPLPQDMQGTKLITFLLL